MRPIRLFSHAVCEPPGYIVDLIESLQLPWEQVCLFDGQQVPKNVENVSALIFMGGPGDVNQPESWMLQEFDLIQRAVAKDIPMLGICLGAQLMARAMGGSVWQGESVEVGWHQVNMLDSARDYPVFASLPSSFQAFQWHAHNCTPPAGAIELATSDCTPCQAFALGKHLALQFHLEMTPEIIRRLVDKYAEDLIGDSPCVQSREQVLEEIEQKCRDTFLIADQMLIPWLQSINGEHN